jgi:hypothetical protein
MNKKYFFATVIFCNSLIVFASGISRSNYTDPKVTAGKFNPGNSNSNHLKQSLAANSPAFTENKGQILSAEGRPATEVKFVFENAGVQLFLMGRGIAYQFTKTHLPEGYSELISKKGGTDESIKIQEMTDKINTETYRMDMTLVGANINARISSEGRSLDYTNYYNRNIMDVHSYTKVTYHEIYTGIDWVIYTVDGKVKYDFVVKAGADPSIIKMQFENHEEISLNKDGSLFLKNRLGTITEKTPVSFQNKKVIQTEFDLKGNKISFNLESYDRTKQLIIDPSLIWATYYGGAGLDYGTHCTTDNTGNVYMAGYALSTASIASGGYQNTFGGGNFDAFIVKFNSAGIRLWATYYGGTGQDRGYACATDQSGNVYLSGTTTSSVGTAIASAGGHQPNYGGGQNLSSDAFLVKFDNTGVRQWGTYYGDVGTEDGYSCSTDKAGNIYMTGHTGGSTVGIATPGSHQAINSPYGGAAYLVKFNNNGLRQWGTYYWTPGIYVSRCCVTDKSGNIYISGYTFGNTYTITTPVSHQPSPGGSGDAFLTKFDSLGAVEWATFYGGVGYDLGFSCATDTAGDVYLTGSAEPTSSVALVTPGSHQTVPVGYGFDAFLAKFHSSGVRLWSTLYGGASSDYGFSCSTDASGNVYLAGGTESSVGIASGGYQNNLTSLNDAYLIKFNINGVRQWGTYYGSYQQDMGQSCATDIFGNVYLAGYSDSKTGMSKNGHQNIAGDTLDAFLAKFCNFAPAKPSALNGNTFVCQGSSQLYSVTPDGAATSYTWSTPAGWTGSSSINSISLTAGNSGVVSVEASNACGVSPSQSIHVASDLIPVISANSGSICAGEIFTIQPVGAASYTIAGGSFIVSPPFSTLYLVNGSSAGGCAASNTATVNLIVDACTALYEFPETVSVDIFPNPNTGNFEIRSGFPVDISIYNEVGQLVLQKHIVTDEKSISIQGLAKGIYVVHLTSSQGSCVKKIVTCGE